MTKKKFNKKCKYCKESFAAMNVRKIFCSDKCKRNSSRKNRSKMFMETCEVCKKVFSTYYTGAKCCSNKCRLKLLSRRKTGKFKKCKECEKKFELRQVNQVFCSKNCTDNFYKRNPRMETLKCNNCGKIFKRQFKSKKLIKNFCSPKCNGEYRTEMAIDKRACEHCNKNFTTKKAKKKKFCSNRCSVKRQGTTMTSPHRKTVEILRRNRIWNRSERRVGRYLLDCYLGKGLAIEVQGRYWHGDVRIYETPKNDVHEKVDRKDRRKKDFLGKNGITVLYIWEDDIENDPEMCEKLILKFKERNGILSNYHSMNYHTRGRSVALNRKILVPRFEL